MAIFFAMIVYSYSMAITPGPANLLSLSTGVNYGFKQAIPFVLGASTGFNTLLAFIGFGLGEISGQNELFFKVLGFLGTGYICYMAYKVATSHSKVEVKDQQRPAFHNGFIVQCLNPKAWVACLAGVSAFNLVGNFKQLTIFIFIEITALVVSLSTWAYAGSKITLLLADGNRLKNFNYIMGAALFLVALYLLYIQL